MRIDLTPQLIKLFATSWAYCPGVAIIPIATLNFSQYLSKSLRGLMTKPATWLFIFFGSASNNPTIPTVEFTTNLNVFFL